MNTFRIAIDVESGDYGSRVIIAGLLEARTICNFPFKAFLCGNKKRIETVIAAYKAHDKIGDYEIVECNDIIDPGEKRASVWKKQTGASIIRCITLQKEQVVDASISAGDTAILLGAALFILGRSNGAARPALAAFLPTIKNKPVLLLDVGANLSCRPEHLASFALMGNNYVNRFLGITSPEIALLSIGKEAVKGTRILSETEMLLKNSAINYCGFVEGNDIIAGKADVVVCDGFCGNVLLKAFESFHTLAQSVFGEHALLDGTYKKNIGVLDPETYGAVPFLGIHGTVLKAHGGSSSHAIANALQTSINAVNRKAVWDAVILKGN
jgi:phosphate acyltransferase